MALGSDEPRARRVSFTAIAGAACAGAALWLSLGVLAVADAERARRVGLLPPLWLAAALVLAAVAIAIVIRPSSRATLPLFLSLLVVLPWIPLNVPDLFLAWAGRAVLFVWAAILFACIAIVVQERAPRGAAHILGPRRAPFAAAALAFLVFLAFWTGQALPPNGDEPHYLVITESLIHDRDVKVANNYERGDYIAYYGGALAPHYSRPGVHGDRYSWHAPGLPALIAPVFALGGYHAVVVWIALLVALGTAFVWKAAYVLTGNSGAAWFGWAAVTVTSPVVVHGTLIYPDPIAGVVLAAGTLALVVAADRHAVAGARRDGAVEPPPWPPWLSFALAASIGLLPWLHTRLAIPAALLAAVLLLRIARDPSFAVARWHHVAALCAPLALPLAGWFLFFWTAYGTLNPAIAFGDRIPFDAGRIPGAALALAVDQEFGLLPNAPVHLLWIAGVWSLCRRNLRLGGELLALVVPYVIALSAYPTWWAGSSAPARFLVPLVFPLGVAMASAWASQGGRGRAVSLTLLGASVLIAAAFAGGGGGLLAYNAEIGRARWLDWAAPLVNLPGAFPSFFRGPVLGSTVDRLITVDLVLPALCWGAALLAGWAIYAALDRWLRATAAVRSLAAPACLALACGLGATGSWLATGGVHVMATRAQLELLGRRDPQRLPHGVQLVPLRSLPAGDVPARLAVTTAPFPAPPAGMLLYLEEVPPGDYRLRVTRTPGAAGELTLGVGRATLPAARWPVTADQARVVLPVRASILTISGDAEARRSVQEVALVPQRAVIGGEEIDFPAGAARARDAARYGAATVLTLDDRVWLEPQGFWVMGARAPEVVIAVDQPAPSAVLAIRNGPARNRLRLSAGSWSAARELGANEEWRVDVPMQLSRLAAIVRFEVERGVVPAELDPASGDRRLLGCWVEIH